MNAAVEMVHPGSAILGVSCGNPQWAVSSQCTLPQAER